MRVKIYQINTDRDISKQKFMKLDVDKNVPSSIYDEVFNAEIDETDLEAVFMRFNTTGHPLFRGHSLSVSDVIVMDGKAHYCQNIGFNEIPFDESQTQKPDNLMRVVYVEPDKPAYVAEIAHTLEAEQKAVGGGLIQTLYFEDDNTTIVANDEAKLIGMPGNRRFGDGSTIVAGPFFVVGITDDDFRSLTDEEVVKYMDEFAVPDQISQDEVEADMGFMYIYGI